MKDKTFVSIHNKLLLMLIYFEPEVHVHIIKEATLVFGRKDLKSLTLNTKECENVILRFCGDYYLLRDNKN